MRSVRDELTPRVLELRQALPHPLERGRELPDLVLARVLDGLAEVAAGDPVGGPLEAPDPAGEHRRRQVPDQKRGGQGDQAGDHQPPTHEVDALERVPQRRLQQHNGPTEDGVSHLRIARAARADRTAHGARRRERLRHEGIVLDVGGGDRVRVDVHHQLGWVVGKDPEIDDPGIGAVGRLLDRVVEREARAVQELGSDRRRRFAESAELGVDQVVLERRNDDQVDEDERPRDHEGKAEAETAPDAS